MYYYIILMKLLNKGVSSRMSKLYWSGLAPVSWKEETVLGAGSDRQYTTSLERLEVAGCSKIFNLATKWWWAFVNNLFIINETLRGLIRLAEQTSYNL